jgi:cation diffusion facilitator CzcD-associated flavoprotein CzcO
MEEFEGTLYHSDFHTNAEQFRGKRVVVVGAVSSMSQFHTCAHTYESVRGMLVEIYVKIL